MKLDSLVVYLGVAEWEEAVKITMGSCRHEGADTKCTVSILVTGRGTRSPEQGLGLISTVNTDYGVTLIEFLP